MARLFVAVWPPPDVVAELTRLHRKDERGVRFVVPENWHVTLRFLGEADPDEVAAALDPITFTASTAVLGPAVDVLGPRTLAVPVRGLDDLAATVVDATRSIGDPPPRRRFHGHVTIARRTRNGRMPRALGTPVTARWTVDEVALVRSRLDPDHARYETLATWACAGQPGSRSPTAS